MNGNSLDRIADALERIAEALESQPNRLVARPAVSAHHYGTPALVQAEEQDIQPSGEVALFLKSRSIYIKSMPEPSDADPELDSVATYLAERYESLSGLLRHLKRCMQLGRSFTYPIADLGQEAISSNCQFCSRLHELAFLTQYTYRKSPRCVIHATVSAAPIVQRFLGGHWLERFAGYSIGQAFGEDIELVMNPQIILPNGDDFELDVFGVASDGTPIWLEAKSGEYQQYVGKYSKTAKLLGLPKASSIMLLPDLPAARCEALGSLFAMTVVNLGNLRTSLESVAQTSSVG